MAAAQIGSPCSPMGLVIDDPVLDLVEKTKGILLSLLTTLGKVESEVYSESLLVQFEEHLQELDHAIENSVGTAAAKGIFEGLQSGLEKFSDYLYRITKSETKGKQCRFPLVYCQLSSSLLNWLECMISLVFLI